MPVILKGSEGEEGNNYRKSDEVESFEQAMEIMKLRLKYLRFDLGLSTSIEDSLIHELLTAYEDKKISLMDLYAHFYSPCKVSDPGLTVKGTGDMTDVMVDFSEGYEKFIKSLGDEYVNYMIRRRSAAVLLSKLLSLEYPRSKVLYLHYFKEKSDVNVAKALFCSRATFYRTKKEALEELTLMYYPHLASKAGNSKSANEE